MRTQNLPSIASRDNLGNTAVLNNGSFCQHPELGIYFFINNPTLVFVPAAQNNFLILVVKGFVCIIIFKFF